MFSQRHSLRGLPPVASPCAGAAGQGQPRHHLPQEKGEVPAVVQAGGGQAVCEQRCVPLSLGTPPSPRPLTVAVRASCVQGAGAAASKKEASPEASIMDMMKKMYDEGDDNMKVRELVPSRVRWVTAPLHCAPACRKLLRRPGRRPSSPRARPCSSVHCPSLLFPCCNS